MLAADGSDNAPKSPAMYHLIYITLDWYVGRVYVAGKVPCGNCAPGRLPTAFLVLTSLLRCLSSSIWFNAAMTSLALLFFYAGRFILYSCYCCCVRSICLNRFLTLCADHRPELLRGHGRYNLSNTVTVFQTSLQLMHCRPRPWDSVSEVLVERDVTGSEQRPIAPRRSVNNSSL
jgi:hypothetical protein